MMAELAEMIGSMIGDSTLFYGIGAITLLMFGGRAVRGLLEFIGKQMDRKIDRDIKALSQKNTYGDNVVTIEGETMRKNKVKPKTKVKRQTKIKTKRTGKIGG